MHFPSVMALRGSHLAIASSSADGKYFAGRFVIVDMAAALQSIASNDPHEPIAWDKVVRSNAMIPQETGEIYFSDSHVVFAGRQNSQLIAMPVTKGVAPCNDFATKAENCGNASSLMLSEYDPFALVGIVENASEERILASYLSSDRLDMITIDKTKINNALSITKSFHALELVSQKVDAATLRNQRMVTRKMFVTELHDPARAKVYFLVEQHSQKIQTPTKPKTTFLVAIKVNDLIANSTLTDQNIELWDLNNLASIAGAQDFFVDDATKEVYVLARLPEALYKIDLTQKTPVEIAPVCTGATSMAINPADDTIVVPCFTENRLTAFSMKTLAVKNTTKVLGRGPSSVIIDKTSGTIFCTLTQDGIVAILDKNFTYIGHLFDKAPLNRIGS